MRIVYFLIGAGIGAPTRFVIDRYFRSEFSFPYGILIVNVFGSFILGIVTQNEGEIPYLLFGFCGALTTWSAFALDLFESRTRFKEFSLNLLGNYLLGVSAALLGVWLTQ